MKKFKHIKNSLLLIVAALVINSCKKNDDVVVKDVDFSLAVNGYSVTFTNATTDAKSYKWDFGDGKTSTDESPVHTYAGKGKFVATLEATLNNGKTISGSTIVHLSKSSPVKLDDNSLADWDTISTVFTSAGKGGIVKKAKFDYDSENIYIYMEIASKKSNGDIFDFYLDTDNDATTGLLTGDVPGGGYDYLLEGQALLGSMDMFKHTGAQADFSFDQLSVAEFYKVGTIVQDGDILKYELSLSRGKIGGLTGKAVTLGIILTKSDWSVTLGTLPDAGQQAITLNIGE